MTPIEFPNLPISFFCSLSKALKPAKFKALKKSIRLDGQKEPIIMRGGEIFDGRHRYLALKELWDEDEKAGVPPQQRKLPKTTFDAEANKDPALFFYQHSCRRSPDETETACMAIELEEYLDALPEHQPSALSRYRPKRGAHVRPCDDGDNFFGAGTRLMTMGRTLRREAPDLYAECREGRMAMRKADAQYRRRKKEAAAKSVSASAPAATPADIQILYAEALSAMEDAAAKCQKSALVIIDSDGPKSASNDDQAGFVDDMIGLVNLSHQCLTDTGALVIFARDEYAAETVIAIKDYGFHLINWVKWDESFGNTPGRWSRTGRHILYATKHRTNRTFNAAAATSLSARMRIYNDARAGDDGHTMPDVWTDIPKLPANHPERLPGQPDQLPEALISRLILTLSNPGDVILDPFTGAGTVPVVCLKTGRKCLAFEIDESRANAARQRVASVATKTEGEIARGGDGEIPALPPSPLLPLSAPSAA